MNDPDISMNVGIVPKSEQQKQEYLSQQQQNKNVGRANMYSNISR